jgi:hypothetical protein
MNSSQNRIMLTEEKDTRLEFRQRDAKNATRKQAKKGRMRELVIVTAVLGSPSLYMILLCKLYLKCYCTLSHFHLIVFSSRSYIFIFCSWSVYMTRHRYKYKAVLTTQKQNSSNQREARASLASCRLIPWESLDSSVVYVCTFREVSQLS